MPAPGWKRSPSPARRRPAFTSAAFQPVLNNFAAIDTLDTTNLGASLSSLNLPSGILSAINKLVAHPS